MTKVLFIMGVMFAFVLFIIIMPMFTDVNGLYDLFDAVTAGQPYEEFQLFFAKAIPYLIFGAIVFGVYLKLKGGGNK
jgi:hypothetical protein